MGHGLPRHLAERAAVMPPKAAAPSCDQGEAGQERKFTGSLFQLHEARLPKRVKRRMLGTARLLFDQQQPALLVAVGGIYGGEQAPTLDQPWLVVRIDVKDEH